MGSTSFKWNRTALRNLKTKTFEGLVMMGNDIHRKAKYKAPYLTGALMASIRVKPKRSENAVYVIAGTKDRNGVPYAYRREFENYAHPSKRYYMQKSLGEEMRSDWHKNFRRFT